MAVLSADAVASIRGLWATRAATQGQIASWFGVSRGHINNIVNRKQWK